MRCHINRWGINSHILLLLSLFSQTIAASDQLKSDLTPVRRINESKGFDYPVNNNISPRARAVARAGENVPAPVINTWYRYGQPSSGQLGLSQKWMNILGNVSTQVSLSSFVYSVNGGTDKTLRVGSDHRRLQDKGDFNIEIDHTSLNVGLNQIEIKAKDSQGQESSKVVTLNYDPTQFWPLPYTANWGAVTDIKDIENIAHVVDGLWKLTSNGIRTIQTGYDRSIAIGDNTWASDYEVTVPFTPHTGFSGIGFAVGWQGHEGVRDPKIEWPLQALAWVRGPISHPTLEILTYGGLPPGPNTWENVVTPDPQYSVSVSKDVTYMLKSSSSPIGNGKSRFSVKLWPQSESEPIGWNVSADIKTREGSVFLVAYNTDVTFGNVTVKPISTSVDNTPPVINNIQVSSVSHSTATITWMTDEPSNSVINYGLNSSYRSKKVGSTQATTHNITLTGLTPNTTYHYQVKSADRSNNTASSNDRVFTTSDSSSNSTGLVSDEFDGALNTSLWSFYDPIGDSTLSTTGTQATISVPAGSNHDLWKNKLFAPRIRQAANNTDFEVEVKFDALLSAQYQGNGITVEQDLNNLLRFDFYSDGSVTRIFSGSFVNGEPSERLQSVITHGTPKYLKVSRTGDKWTVSYSLEGTSWTVATAYTHSLNVSSVAVFGSNAGSTPPAHTAYIDYFRVN